MLSSRHLQWRIPPILQLHSRPGMQYLTSAFWHCDAVEDFQETFQAPFSETSGTSRRLTKITQVMQTFFLEAGRAGTI